METEVEIQTDIEKSKGKRKKIFIIVFLSVIVLIFLGYEAYFFFQKQAWLKSRLNTTTYTALDKNAYRQSLLNNNPTLIQDSFVADTKNGVNDQFTKSDAYFLTHRYFDNGGNVYEIYDYVNSHPSLAFLKEAEDLRPDIFDQIKNKTISPVPYNTSSLYAILAYLEVLDKHGYADIAALGTLANQYAKTAYSIKRKSELLQNGPDATSMIEDNTKRAVFFELKAKESMIQTFDSNGLVLMGMKNRPKSLEKKPLKDILPHNLLVGLNQYAACLRYLEASGTDISVIDSPVSAADIFASNMLLAKQFVPELEIFTSLLNASTLSLVSPQSTDAIRVALQPILHFDVNKRTGIITTLLKAKEYSGFDIYSKTNAVTLANIVPEFKMWLLSSGDWTEADFKLN